MGTAMEFMADRRHNLWSAHYDEGVPLGLIRPTPLAHDFGSTVHWAPWPTPSAV
ncbi:hypothetical protein [Streptomyces agglomeratus]|uniref:hypothetical protein n=1 Tax=Streptomyces agglomeratus TaxID=285458 RepID=UPI00159F0D51|nr:hypothetical protein [Streptomyces agglomeratus]